MRESWEPKSFDPPFFLFYNFKSIDWFDSYIFSIPFGIPSLWQACGDTFLHGQRPLLFGGPF